MLLHQTDRFHFIRYGPTCMQFNTWTQFIPINQIIFWIDLMLPAALWPSDRLSLQQKWVPGIFLGGKGLLSRKADNLTAICGPIV
jgi:hypothetical protein